MASGMQIITFSVAVILTTVGILKVAPIEPGYGFMVSLMNQNSRVTPLRYLGINLSGTGLRALVAILEIAFGPLIVLGRNDWPVVGGFVALCISTHGLLCQIGLGDPAVNFVIPIITFMMIVVMIFGRDGLLSRHGKLHLS